MKIYRVSILAIFCIPSTVAFVVTDQKPVKTQLYLKSKDGNNFDWDHMVGPAMTGLAGLTLASNMAVAATADPSSLVKTSEIDATPIVLLEGTLSNRQGNEWHVD